MTDEDASETLSRRGFMRAATVGTAAAVGAAGTAAAQEGEGDGSDGGGEGTTTGGSGGGGGGGGTETVEVGPGGQNVFKPAELYVTPGTTVEFVWKGPGHNVNATSSPGDSWTYTGPIVSPPNTYTHTFEQTGEYEYQCDPHASLGMTGTIIVNESGQAPGGGGGGPTLPQSAMTLGVATVAAMVSTLSLAFFFLKYGGDYETPE